jgi:multiple antibiotic resistance protein
MEWINFALIMQIFILLNPLASVPFLISAYRRKLNVKSIAVKSVMTAFIIAVVITFFCGFLFKIFGITLDSLRIAGGVVLLLLGIDMIRPKRNEEHIDNVDELVALISTPTLTGPGTISYLTIKVQELGTGIVLSNLIFAFLLVGIVFILISVFIKRINLKVTGIISRVLGLFLTAVSIEMMSKGIENIIHTNFG